LEGKKGYSGGEKEVSRTLREGDKNNFFRGIKERARGVLKKKEDWALENGK